MLTRANLLRLTAILTCVAAQASSTRPASRPAFQPGSRPASQPASRPTTLPVGRPAERPAAPTSGLPLVSFLGDLNTAPVPARVASRLPGVAPRWLATDGEHALFARLGDATGIEPWFSDGTPSGTRLLADLEPGDGSSDPHHIVSIGRGRFVFVASMDGAGRRLYVTDGTPDGTQVLADAEPATRGEAYTHLARVGERVFFCVAGAAPMTGTPATTHAVAPPATTAPATTTASTTTASTTTASTTTAATTTQATTAPVTTMAPATAPTTAPIPTVGASAADLDLWVTDGTPAGTRHVRRLPNASPGQSAFAFAGRYYLRERRPANRVWISDGTAEGTRAVAISLDADPATTDGHLWFSNGRGSVFRADADFGSVVEVAANADPDARMLRGLGPALFHTTRWQFPLLIASDAGPAAGRAIKGSPAFGQVTGLFPAGGKMFLTVLPPQPANRPREPGRPPSAPPKEVPVPVGLYVSDGTATGTRPVRLPPHAPGVAVRAVAANANGAFFAIEDARGSQLYFTDGTPSGTRRVMGVPNADGSSKYNGESAAGRIAFFTADLGEEGVHAFASDGTAAGTQRLTPPSPAATADASPVLLALPGGRFVGIANTATMGREPFVSDGTAPGTTPIDTVVGPRSGMHFDFAGVVSAVPTESVLARVGPHAYFVVRDPTRGSHLWRSDGTIGGTAPLLDLTTPAEDSEHDISMAFRLLGGSRSLYIEGRVGERARVWRFDTQTQRLGVEWSGPEAKQSPPVVGMPGNRRPANRAPAQAQRPPGLRASPKVEARSLVWRDRLLTGRQMATGQAAVLLSAAVPGEPMGVVYDGLQGVFVPLAFADATLADQSVHVYYLRLNNMDGAELWQTDGTAAGTRAVSAIQGGGLNRAPEGLVTTTGVYFRPVDLGSSDRQFGGAGSQLYRFDAAAERTTRVGQPEGEGLPSMQPASRLRAMAQPADFVADAEHLYFTAATDAGGRGLYRTDGTTAGTALLKVLSQTSGVADATQRVLRVGSSVLFTAPGGEVWSTDGTPEGTRLEDFISAQFRGRRPSLSPLDGERALVVARHPQYGAEAWVINDRFAPRPPRSPTSRPTDPAAPASQTRPTSAATQSAANE